MNRSKKGKSRKASQKQSHAGNRLGCIITILVLIPILFGVYLYCRQFNPQREETPQTEVAHPTVPPATTTYPIPSGKELEIPQSLVPRQEQLIRHAGYTVSYNKDLRIPNWVSYELTRAETTGKNVRSNRFITDPLAVGPIATNADYTRSGYDKGHMAPAADMKWSAEAMKESFYFSNMCPQHPQLNRRGWKNLETKIRDWAIADSAIIIICGPIVAKHSRTIGKNKVAVPRQFFKVVLSPFAKPMRAIGFLFNNAQATAPLSSYVVTIDSIESLTHMDFFAPLPDEIENRIEATADYALWPNAADAH